MAVNYYLENRLSKSGDAPIRVSISICGVRLLTSIGYSINPIKWDSKKQKIKQGYSNSKGITYNTINAHLNAIDNFFIEYENTALKNNTKVTQEDIKNILKINFGTSKSYMTPKNSHDKTFLNHFDDFIIECGDANSWSRGTYQKMQTVRNHVVKFNPTPIFETFDGDGLINYMSYLRTTKGLRNVSIAKQLELLKWFFRWATSKGYSDNTDYISFKPKLKTSDKKVIFLTREELMLVYRFEMPENKAHLGRARDVFCFCSFTSLRYSDVYNLKRSNIVDDTLCITTIKTSDSLTIELNKYSREILDKYANTPFEGGKALPVVGNQIMNDYLKEIGKLCGIDQPQTIVYFNGNVRIEETLPKYELLTTHVGRKTFICNALALGIPAQVVMKWTGHSDYKSMKPYIDVADSIKAKAMSKFDEI
jgi:integrase